jgi:hypothetical protein
VRRRLVDAGAGTSPDGSEIDLAQLVSARLWLLWCLAELGAVELADELGMRPLSAQTRLDLALVYEEQGMVAARTATAAEAARLLESMAMRDWLTRRA